MESDPRDEPHGCTTPRVIVAIHLEGMCDRHARLLVDLLTDVSNASVKAYMGVINKPVMPVEVHDNQGGSVN